MGDDALKTSIIWQMVLLNGRRLRKKLLNSNNKTSGASINIYSDFEHSNIDNCWIPSDNPLLVHLNQNLINIIKLSTGCNSIKILNWETNLEKFKI